MTPLAPPSIRSLRYLGSVGHHRTPKWWMVGQDGGQSIPLDDGSVLFVYSDTLLAALSKEHPTYPVPGQFHHELGSRGMFLANSAGIARGDSLQQALEDIRYFHDDDGFLREILSPIDRERLQKIRFWPEHGIQIDGKVYLFYLGIQTIDATTIWGFQNVGTGLAVFDPATGKCQRLWRGGDWCLWKNSHDDYHFGVQVLEHEGWIYVFGSLRLGIFSVARLARVRPQHITDVESYEFLLDLKPEGETKWGPSFAEAHDLGLCSSDYSVSYNPHLNRWLMFFVDRYSKRLMLRTAKHLWGPYDEPLAVVGLPHDEASEMIYLGFEHPNFSREDGRKVFLSYCQPRFAKNSLLTLDFA